MTIHDHFDGSAHCVECKGFCKLSGEDRHLTDYVRFTLEAFAMSHDGWLPSGVENALAGLYGERYSSFRRRAVQSIREIKQIVKG